MSENDFEEEVQAALPLISEQRRQLVTRILRFWREAQRLQELDDAALEGEGRAQLQRLIDDMEKLAAEVAADLERRDGDS